MQDVDQLADRLGNAVRLQVDAQGAWRRLLRAEGRLCAAQARAELDGRWDNVAQIQRVRAKLQAAWWLTFAGRA